MSKEENKQIVGWLERVWFPELDPQKEGVIAKIDTGADTGALHVEYVKEKTDKDGSKYIEFQPLHADRPAVKMHKYKKVRVRSSNGEQEKRFSIKTKVKIRDKVYPIALTLTDRSDMTYDVIIGRKFLKDKFLVDVSKHSV